MNRYWYIGLILITLGFESSLWGTPFSVRKKNLESKIRILKEIDAAIGMSGEDTGPHPNPIEQLARKAAEILQSPSGREKVRLLGLLEEDLHHLMIAYSDRMDSSAGDLLDAFSRDYFLKNEWKTMKDPGIKEKILRYYEMAKKEREQGKSYQRMNNPLLALLSFKRSILYSFRSFHLTQTELPASYNQAYETWIKEDPPGFAKKFTAEESEMERNEN